MKSQISFTTDIFESKNVKPFGKDLAEWLIGACGGHEFSFGEPFQDDWGWSVLAEASGEKFVVAADMVFKAIGQMLVKDGLDGNANVLEMSAGRIAVDAQRRTSVPGVWAGGDCVAGGQDLTVVAVEDGKRAALAIDRHLRADSKTGVHHG